jgi:hypothetical protein
MIMTECRALYDILQVKLALQISNIDEKHGVSITYINIILLEDYINILEICLTL